MDGKAVWAARVPRRRSGSEESEAARGRFFEANCGAWGHVVDRISGFSSREA